MDVSDIIAVVDDHGFSDVSSTRKLSLINDVVWDICAEEAWPFLEKSVTFAFDGSSAIPTNYPTDVDVVLSIVDSSIPRRLYPLRWESWRNSISSTNESTNDDPLYYYFIGDVLYVHPIPLSTNTTTVMLYEAVQPELTLVSTSADILMPSRYHSAICFGVLTQLYSMEDDLENSAFFEAKYDKKMMKMRDRLWQRQLDRPDSIEVTDPEDIYDLIP